MKRFATLFILIIFIVGSFCTVSSFAEKNDSDTHSQTTKSEKSSTKYTDEDDEGDKDDEDKEDEEKDDEDASGSIDTSWFNYKSPKKAYNITSEAQLRGLASLVNEEQAMWKTNRVETFEGVTFTLTKDIKLTSEWTPIGRDSSVCFAGVFDGDGHKISGMKVNSTSDETGLFGYLRGEVKDLTVTGSIKSTGGNCGGIAGDLDSAARISGCTADVDIKADKKTGGIVGNNSGGTIENCVNKGNISGTYKVGGVVGENWGGTIEQCGNDGNISSSRRGVATFGTGGVAGRSVASTAIISECYNTGKISSATEATGGIVGYTNAAESTVTDSYSVGDITIKKLKKKLKLTDSWAGGVVGIVGTDGVVITNCYGAGEISGADTAGGVLGRYIAEDSDTADAHIKNNYYLSESASAGIGDNKGSGGADIQGCVSRVSGGSLSGMASALSISYKKDSSGIYGGSGYPVLRWQEPMSSEDRSYLEGVSKDVQMKLDKYLINNTDATNTGDMVLSIFNPDSYLTDALLQYSETMEQQEKDLAKKNEKQPADDKKAGEDDQTHH